MNFGLQNLRVQAYQFSSGFVFYESVDSLHSEVSRSGYISYSRVTASLAVTCNGPLGV